MHNGFVFLSKFGITLNNHLVNKLVGELFSCLYQPKKNTSTMKSCKTVRVNNTYIFNALSTSPSSIRIRDKLITAL